jgi:hypothetical protein
MRARSIVDLQGRDGVSPARRRLCALADLGGFDGRPLLHETDAMIVQA